MPPTPGDDPRTPGRIGGNRHVMARRSFVDVADLGLPVDVPSTALFTDQYELTMLRAA